MNKRGQSALEYLMTYGWALIVIAIVIGVLIYIMSTSTGGVQCQSQSTQMVLKEWAVVAGTDGVGITLQNATGGQIDTITATPSDDFSDAGANVAISADPVSSGGTFTITNVDAPAAGSVISNGVITIDYTTAGGLPASATIKCSGTV